MSKMSNKCYAFASDNMTPAHPNVIASLQNINKYGAAYGNDEWTREAVEIVGREINVPHDRVFFAPTGTAANVLSLKFASKGQGAVICSQTAHINTDEHGAPEVIGGLKLLAIATEDGKVTANKISPLMADRGVERRSQPKILSISQSTELGTVYSLHELQEVISCAHKEGLLVHMDGARISNAAASLGASLEDICNGVDILSLGLTKNGAIDAEMVVLINPKFDPTEFKYFLKSHMCVFSKTFYKAVQVKTMFEGSLWLRNSLHANAMRQLLQDKLLQQKIIAPESIVYSPDANALIVTLPNPCIDVLREKFEFYIWKRAAPNSQVRWMTSWMTTEEDVREFVAYAVMILTLTLVVHKEANEG